MTSSIYGFTVTALAMYIFLGTSVSLGKRRNFAHVFGKRNDGYLQDNNANDIYGKQHTDPLLDKIRIYQALHKNRNDKDGLLSDTFFNQNGNLESVTQALETYEAQPTEDSVSILDILSPVEKDYLALLYDINDEIQQIDKLPKYN